VKRLIFLLISMLLVLGLMLGCSNDSSTNNTTLKQGDTTSGDFQFAQDVIGGGTMDEIPVSINLSFGLMGRQFAEAPGKEKANTMALLDDDNVILIDSASYSYLSGWHVFHYYVTVVDTTEDDTVAVNGIDSIQIKANGTPLPALDTTMDELDLRNHFAFNSITDTGSGSGYHALDIAGDLMGTGLLAINGSGIDSIQGTFSDSSASCTLHANTNITVNDINVNNSSDCPTSGNISITANMTLACSGQGSSPLDSLNINGGWTVTATFTGNQIKYTYSNATTTWSATETCSETTGKVTYKVGF